MKKDQPSRLPLPWRPPVSAATLHGKAVRRMGGAEEGPFSLAGPCVGAWAAGNSFGPLSGRAHTRGLLGIVVFLVTRLAADMAAPPAIPEQHRGGEENGCRSSPSLGVRRGRMGGLKTWRPPGSLGPLENGEASQGP